MEKWNPGGTTYYPIFGPDGEFISMMTDYTNAWTLANSIDGWLGETTFAKPLDFDAVENQNLREALKSALDPNALRVRRGRPVRKSDSVDESTAALDQPEAA